MSKKQKRVNKLIQLSNALGSPCDIKKDGENVTHIIFTLDRRDSFISHIESMLNDEGIFPVNPNSKVGE